MSVLLNRSSWVAEWSPAEVFGSGPSGHSVVTGLSVLYIHPYIKRIYRLQNPFTKTYLGAYLACR